MRFKLTHGSNTLTYLRALASVETHSPNTTTLRRGVAAYALLVAVAQSRGLRVVVEGDS